MRWGSAYYMGMGNWDMIPPGFSPLMDSALTQCLWWSGVELPADLGGMSVKQLPSILFSCCHKQQQQQPQLTYSLPALYTSHLTTQQSQEQSINILHCIDEKAIAQRM